MPTFRDSLRPIIAIVIASAILMLLLAPLASTEWADVMRGAVSAEEGFEGATSFSIVMIIGPLIKITLLMGIPGLITLGVRNLIGRVGKA